MQKTAWNWIIGVGLFSVAAQIIVFYLRFERWSTDSTFMDYLLFFLAGALGGWILTYFLNRQTSTTQRRWVLTGFLVGTPPALFMMVGGGLFSLLGVLLLPQIPWALFTWIGSAVGRLVVRK
jgi:hypothetical protein